MKEFENHIYFANFGVTDIYNNNYDYTIVSNYLMEQNEVKRKIQLFTEFNLKFGEGYFIIPKETYNSVLKPVFDEIKSMQIEEENNMDINLETYMPKSEINGWILTDDDNLQYIKKESIYEFECIQMAPYPTDDLISDEDEDKEYYQVCQANIDIMYYIKCRTKDFINTLASYDYCDWPDDENYLTREDGIKVLNAMYEEYGEQAYQLIAECLFEDIPFYDIRIYKGVEEKCIAFIENYCKNQ